MIILTQTTICDACKEPITSDDHVRYLNNHVHFHYDCGVKLNQWLRDHEDIDKFLSALVNSDKRGIGNLTVRHFIDGTDEACALIRDRNYYLFIDNCDMGAYQCLCNSSKAIPAVIAGLNPREERVMAACYRGNFYEVIVKISVLLGDGNGNAVMLQD